MEQKYIVAIEIGSSKVKGAVGTFDNSNKLTVMSVVEEKLNNEELRDSVRYGMIQNVEKVADIVDRICDKLEKSAAVAPRQIAGVYVGVGARSMFASQAEVSRQFAEETLISDDFVDQLKVEARRTSPADKEVVDITPRAFTIDNTSAPINPTGRYGRSIKGNFMLVTCRPTVTRNIDRVIAERLEMKINGLITRPIAEANLVLTDEEKRLGCMLVDFGAETVSVVIFKNGVMQYLAVLPIGSRNITRDLMMLNYTEERAEDIKIATGNIEPSEFNNGRTKAIEELDNSDVNNIIFARAGEIISNIVEQIRYAQLKPEDLPGGIVIVGGGAKLKGFNSQLAAQSKMKVRHGTPRGLLSILDSRIQSDEAVDVISLLVEASHNLPRECTFVPEPVKPAVDEECDDDDDVEVRIGSDIPFGNKKHKNKEKEKRVEEIDDEPEKETPKKPRFGWLRDRIKTLMEEDDTEDGFSS